MSESHSFRKVGAAVIVDVETTGLDTRNARIVSIAALRVDFSQVTETSTGVQGEALMHLVDPECRIPQAASRIHGLKNRDVKGKPKFAEIAHEVREFIGKAPLVGHNVSYDKQVLNAELKRAGVPTLSRNRSICTMRRYQQWNNNRRSESDLDSAADALEVPGRKGNKHDALEDVTVTARLATVFYMMDNRVPIPGGRPRRPSRRTAKTEASSGADTLKGLAILAALGATAWWLWFT